MSIYTSLWKLIGISGRLPRLPPSLRVLHWGASRRRGAAPDEVVVLQVAVGRRLYIILHVHAVSSNGVSICSPMRRCCAADLPAEPYTACCDNAEAPAADAEACDFAGPRCDQPRSSAPGGLLLRCLPPTLEFLQYQYGADLHDPPLPRRQLLACKPPHMSVMHWETNNGVSGQSNFRHVVSVLCLHCAAAAQHAHVCKGHSLGDAESHHGRMRMSPTHLCQASCRVIMAVQVLIILS